MADTRNINNPQGTQGQQQQGTSQSSRSMEPYRQSEGLSRAGSPFSFMERFMSDMDRLFGGFGPWTSSSFAPRYGETAERGVWAPQIDVFERDGQLVVHADLPGLTQNDIKVNVEEGILTISGERSHSHEHEKGGIYRCERSYGTFRRAIALPEGYDADNIRASFDNGVLEVTMPMPKEQAPKGRSIPIGPKSQATGVKH